VNLNLIEDEKMLQNSKIQGQFVVNTVAIRKSNCNLAWSMEKYNKNVWR
jgi:hypothetical protein